MEINWIFYSIYEIWSIIKAKSSLAHMIKRAGRSYKSRLQAAYVGCDLTNISTVAYQQGPLVKNLVSIFFGRLLRDTFGEKFVSRLKTRAYRLSRIFSRKTTFSSKIATPLASKERPVFKAGDLVRVRSLEEIEATFDYDHSYKGCVFLPEMAEYCNTVQRVLTPVERFLDERAFRIKHPKGIVLLDGLICYGTARFGRCDRRCFYFWRVEWLEKIEPDKYPDN